MNISDQVVPGQHAAPISREAAIAGSAPPAAVDGLLRPARAQCSAHLPSLWDQPRCVLPLAATVRSPTPGKPGGRSADPPAPSGAQPQTPPAVVERIRALREEYPRWGKAKLAVLLQREGIALSASSVGRVLRRLKTRGVIREPRRVRRWRRWLPRPHAQRLPHGYRVQQPGDLVQVDTLDIEVLPNVRRKQFTARDMVSRYDVVEVYGRATAHTATAFLELLVRRMPFAIRALQIDGGSEFRGAFEAACAARCLLLFVVPPHSPKLQSHVERAQRTYREEFYQVWEVAPRLDEHRVQLQTWAHIYNTVRPHQHLNYLTPLEYCERHNHGKG
ncbi:MAG TPA: integrase core domain-containing protein [bacterium]|nr:integrase core domain-containing protein [bacterium]